MTQNERIEDLHSKLTEKALDDMLDEDMLYRRLSGISKNIKLCKWLEKIPTIPANFILIVDTENLDQFITEDFLWRLWAYWVVEEHRDAPLINSVNDISAYVDYPEMRKKWPAPPFNTTEEVEEAIDWDYFPHASDDDDDHVSHFNPDFE